MCKKYKMPHTDPRYLAFTPEELWLEYLEDVAEHSPDKLDQLFKGEDTATPVQYVTGDEHFDAVDDAATKGDFEAVDRMLESWGKPSPAAEDDGFSDAY